MSKTLSDHQDSEHFSYNRTWEDIENMLYKAEAVRNRWEMQYYEAKDERDKKKTLEAMRNMKALEGVIKTLRWTLGDKSIIHPLN